MAKNTITEREKAIVRLQVLSGMRYRNNTLYRWAYPGPEDAVSGLSDIDSVSSRWWSSKKIQAAFQQEKAIIEAEREAERKKIEGEVLTRLKAEKSGSIDSGGNVDYSVPANQLRKLNSLINSSKDNGEILDALKVMISRQDDIAPEKKPVNKQVRAYLPIQCGSCPLYLEKQSKITKNQ